MSLINMEPREKVLHSGATATGNGEILELNSEFGGLSVQISGITSATITFEGTVDGNWVEQRAVNKTTGKVATTATADGIYLFDVVGIRKFRARISAYVSGTIKATANAVLVVPHIPELNVAGAIPAGTNVVGKVGIDQTANGVQLTDGTNTAAILANGKVPVDLTLTGDTSLAANVAIQDGTDPAKKVTVQNGAILTQLSGSNLAEATVLNVTLADTRQQLPDIDCSQVMIIAKRNNTGYIYVGKNTVSSTVYGAELGELDCVVLPVSNANEIYIDASVSGEGISYVAI